MSRISGRPVISTEHVYGLSLRVARHRADGERIDDQARLEAGLDDEQASDFLQHRPIPSKRRASGANRGFGAPGLW